jgi:hypothetical protein
MGSILSKAASLKGDFALCKPSPLIRKAGSEKKRGDLVGIFTAANRREFTAGEINSESARAGIAITPDPAPMTG